MNYATPEDMIVRFGQRELVELTDPEHNATLDAARIERALADAQALADARVGLVYRLPLKGCAKPQTAPGAPLEYGVPPQLTRIVCDVARYYLHDDLAPEHEVMRRYRQAADELEAIAQGRAQLACPWGGPPGELIASDPQSGQDVRFAFGAPALSDAHAESYR